MVFAMKIGLILIVLVVFVLGLSSCWIRTNDIEIQYITDPCLIPIKGNRFKLCSNMIIKAHKRYHAVPKGFKTDLASIPRIMWPVFSPSDYDSIAAAVLHDWHYCCVSTVSRKRADLIFYYGLRHHGMNKFKAYIYFFGVRAIGWAYYTHGEGIARHVGDFTQEQLHGAYNNAQFGLG